MDFELTRTQKEIQKAAGEFAKGEFDPLEVRDAEQQERFPVPVWGKAAELGFLGLHFPEVYGGGGLGLLEAVLVTEALCRQCSTMGIALGLSELGAEAILMSGSAEQKEHYLPAVLEGRLLCAVSLRDLGGSAGRSTECAAQPEGGQLVVGGKKSMVVNAPPAGLYIFLCKDGQPDGSSLLLVEKQDGSIGMQPGAGGLGMRLSAIRNLRMDGVSVSGQSCLGARGSGERCIERLLPRFYLKIAAMALGIAQCALDKSLAYAKERVQFGKKIGQFQITRHKLADMLLDLEQARWLTYLAAARLDSGKSRGGMPAAAKICATGAALNAAYEAIQLHGGYGYITEYEVERLYRDAKALQVTGGHTPLLKDRIADRLFGRSK